MSILVLVLLSVFTLFLLYSTVILPLKSIERAAADIAAGTFSKLPLPKKHDEVSSVLQAFNQMVTELELRQEQLFQAKKLSSIGTLASGTAHQINNPLNNIATSCQLALAEIDKTQNPFIAQMLQTIDQETQRAGEIVRGLLEFSRASNLSIQAVSLKTVVNKALQLVASEVPAGITVEHDIPDNLTLSLDIQKMVEALLNLIINAIQSIKEPPGLVSIWARAEGAQVVITIEDTGVGIEKEHLQKIFDPFFTTKQEGSGTGLGLAVVYGIIKKQDGSIRVESTKGEGSKFIITLPLLGPLPEKRTV
jgi:signal transduction histidine kinase